MYFIDEHHFGLSALIITPNNLLIFENIKQLLFETSSPLEPKSVQNMTNLIEVVRNFELSESDIEMYLFKLFI